MWGDQSELDSIVVVSDEWLSACAEAREFVSLQGHKRSRSKGDSESADNDHPCSAAKRPRIDSALPVVEPTLKSMISANKRQKPFVVVLMVQEPAAGMAFFDLKEKCRQACKSCVHAHCSQFPGER